MNSKFLQIIRRQESNGIQTQLRLFCFPHAGASPVMFNNRWSRNFPPQVQVIGIQYPGRGQRFEEKSVEDIKELVHLLIDDIKNFFIEPLYIPYIVYGHSFGALCAYEFQRQIRNLGFPIALQFIVSGRRAPHTGIVDSPICNLPERELQEACLDRYNAQIITDSDLIQLTIPPLRADLTAIDLYMPDTYSENDPPLDIALTAMVGENDKMVPFKDLNAWGQHVNKERIEEFSTIKINNAPHFFYDNVQFLQVIMNKIQTALTEIEEKGDLVTKPAKKSQPITQTTQVRLTQESQQEMETKEKEKKEKKKKKKKDQEFEDDYNLC